MTDGPFTQFERDEDAPVGVMWRDFVTAVGVMVYTANTPPTVEAVALAFNTTRDLVREAVDEHPWLFISGDRIESDGE